MTPAVIRGSCSKRPEAFGQGPVRRQHIFPAPPELVGEAWDYFRTVQTRDRKYIPFITEKDPPATWLNKATLDKYRPEMKKYYYDPTKYKTYLDQLGINWRGSISIGNKFGAGLNSGASLNSFSTRSRSSVSPGAQVSPSTPSRTGSASAPAESWAPSCTAEITDR